MGRHQNDRNWKSTKCPWVEAVGLMAWRLRGGKKILSPVSLASRDQNGGPSNSTIDIYDLTKKKKKNRGIQLI